MKAQRRGHVIAMTSEELDSFLGEQRTCRVATVGLGGPHVAPVWIVWDGQALWIYSLTRSQRWANLSRDPRVAVVADTGHHYHELRGLALDLAEPEALLAAKYFRPGGMIHDGRHAWLRIAPLKIVSWDFRKLATLPGRQAGPEQAESR